MNVHLPDEVNEFVKHLVVSGRFQSEEEAVAEGLRLLQAQERLRRDVQKGFDRLDAGEGIDADVVFDEVTQVIDGARKKRTDLEAALIEGLESGPAEEWDSQEWQEIKQRIAER